MAFSDDDLIFLRNKRFSREQLIFGAILATLALGIAGFFMRHDRAQPARAAAPIAARPRPVAAPTRPARATTSRAQPASYSAQEKLTLAVENEDTTPTFTAEPTPAVTFTALQPQRVQPVAAPAATPLPRERKVLTRAELDAELARRNEQNARDKAEIDRNNEEKEDAKQERMRLARQREREERAEQLLREARRRRFFTHHRIQPRRESQTISR